MKKRKGPWWWKRRVSCPECGYLYQEEMKGEDKAKMVAPYITCPKCQVRLSIDEFWDQNYSKYDRKADLAGESQ